MTRDLPDDHEPVWVRSLGAVGSARALESDWLAVDLGGGTIIVPSSGVVASTRHSVDRWRQRIGDGDEIDVVEAWSRGAPMSRGYDGDSARIDPDTRAVMVRKNYAIVTVLDRNLLNGALAAEADAALEGETAT